MANYFLSSYTIRLVDKSSGEMLPIDNFYQGTDLYTIFNQNLNSLMTSLSHDSTAQKLLRVSHYSPSARIMSGIIETGEYGYESELYDIQSSVVAHHRTVNEAEMLPFYFLAHLPSHSDEGIILLQRFQQFGIKTIFTNYFEQYFEANYPDIAIKIYPLVPQDLISQYLRYGRVIKIRFIKFNIPSDLADIVAHGHSEEEGEIEFVIKAKRRGHLEVVDRITEVLQGRREVRYLYELRDFEYDSVKIEVDINGRHRTIDLSHLERLNSYFDISSEVQVGSNGHPVYASIHSIANTLLHDLSSAIGHSNV